MASEVCPLRRPPVTVTVCQLRDEPADLTDGWDRLVDHVHGHQSELVLLPETPFFRPLAAGIDYDPGSWDAALDAHHRWEKRLAELAPASVVATQPIDFGNERYNQGFVWTRREGVRSAHAQSSLRCEKGAWESHWYHHAPMNFVPQQVGRVMLGFLIGPELLAADKVSHYRQEPVDVVVTPRIGTPPGPQAWITAGCEAARQLGAFSLSSCRPLSSEADGPGGWVIGPEGEVLALTSAEQPFVSMSLDLAAADEAKRRHTDEVPVRAQHSGPLWPA